MVPHDFVCIVQLSFIVESPGMSVWNFNGNIFYMHDHHGRHNHV